MNSKYNLHDSVIFWYWQTTKLKIYATGSIIDIHYMPNSDIHVEYVILTETQKITVHKFNVLRKA